jgi:hypothetical protein
MTSRAKRRLFDRQFRKLIKNNGDNCSLCGAEFRHNSRSFGGYDQDGKIALVGECCVERLHEVHTAGLCSHRNYDFLAAGQNTKGCDLSAEQAAHALDLCQRAIVAVDKEMPDDLWQRAGMNQPRHGSIHVLDRPWKKDDRDWFERHAERSHRARLPFAGEVEQSAAPQGHQLLMLVRQVEPGKRIRAGLFISSQLPPVPDVEAIAHALFDVATEREPIPRDGKAMLALIRKYTIQDPRAGGKP